jgi:uridine kinase
MRGEKLVVLQPYTDRAADICQVLAARLAPRLTVAIAGECGSGKTSMAHELRRLLAEQGVRAGILQQDDYFVFPPKTNHEMRRRNLEQVGPYEVKLDLMDANLRSFKRSESPIYKPLVVYEEDRITHEEMDVADLDVLIAEGTYTSLLSFADLRVFIDRTYHQTLEGHLQRGRDAFEPFNLQVLEREHQVIAGHKALADIVVSSDLIGIQVIR